jgi:hypothetical protein
MGLNYFTSKKEEKSFSIDFPRKAKFSLQANF